MTASRVSIEFQPESKDFDSETQPKTPTPQTTNKLPLGLFPERPKRDHPIFQEGSQTSVNHSNVKDSGSKISGREGSATGRKKNREKVGLPAKDAKTTTAMKKPHKTILGIFPVRESENVEGLHVMLEGIKASQADHDPIFGPMERANLDEAEKPATPEIEPLEDELKPLSPRPGALLKPAIVAKTGSVQGVSFAHRPHPPSKARSRLKPVKPSRIDSAVSISSSLVSVDIPGSEPFDPDGDARSSGSSTSMKSVKELMDEAKMLATPDVEKAYLKRKKREEDKKTMAEKAKHSKKDKEKKGALSVKSSKSTDDSHVEVTAKNSTERTVDEIIDSLKNPELPGVSEADKQIQEIMKKVLSRSSMVLGDLAPVEENAAESDIQLVATDAANQEADAFGKTADDHPSIPKLDTGLPDPQENDVETPAVIQEALERLEERQAPEEITETLTDTASSLKLSVPPTPQVEKEPTPEIPAKETDQDLSMFYADLFAPKRVTFEDILSVEAGPAPVNPPRVTLPPRGAEGKEDQGQDLSTDSGGFLTSWVSTDQQAKRPKKSIHHFCTAQDVLQLPDHQKGVWRQYHVLNKKGLINGDKLPSRAQTGSNIDMNLEQVQSAAAQRIIEEADPMGERSLTLEDWKTRTEKIFEEPNMGISGLKLLPATDSSFMYWTPAPPKWDLPPTVVKETLFPEYHGHQEEDERLKTPGMMVEDSEESDEDADLEEQVVDPEELLHRERILSRLHKSSEDLTPYLKAIREMQERKKEKELGKPTEDSMTKSESLWSVPESGTQSGTNRTGSATIKKSGPKGGDLDSISEVAPSDMSSTLPPPISFADLRAKFSMAAMGRPASSSKDSKSNQSTPRDSEQFVIPQPRRKASAPGALLKDGERLEESILVYEDYTSTMKEIARQRAALKDIQSGKVAPPGEEADNLPQMDEKAPSLGSHPEEASKVDFVDERLPTYQPKVIVIEDKDKKDEDRSTEAERALEAGKAYVMLPHMMKKKKKKKRQLKADIARIEAIQSFLNQTPATLRRSTSIQNLAKESDKLFKVPKRIKRKRTYSIPDHLDFEAFAKRNGYSGENADTERELARDVWNSWFDERFPPTPPESESEEENFSEEEIEEEIKPELKKETTQNIDLKAMDLSPIIDDEMDVANIELIEEETERLTKAINEMGKNPSAFLLARRGALFRKLGKMKSGLEDLNNAIKLEPRLLDAYWHRHLILLLQGKKQDAIEDLNFILKHNKNHSAAYRSRASVYKEQGNVTMAIINFSQAIKMDPNDHEAYYLRAEMYEKRGEMLLAMEDFAMATKLMPSKTDALFKHGLHYFKNGNWQLAISDLTELLKQNPMDAKARMYRGRAYSKLSQWNNAVQDLSAAIHLNPNDALSFYYRGCILRRRHQKRALQDFSISLLLDDSEDNLLAFLHRGILYNEMGRPEEAIPDFEACIKLNKDLAVAHVSLGLIYLLKSKNYQKAIKTFSQAIQADPTYLRAYVCRAEAYIKADEIKNALLDFTRAIHLRPDVNHYYMYRGKLVLQMGNLDLAAFCVRHAAELNSGLGSSPTQQAIVQTFLKNYDKAIEALQTAVRSKPTTAMFSLLGKTQMKAHYWKDSIKSFEKALETLKPWLPDMTWPTEAADIHFLIGLCRVELRDFLGAHDAFNSAIRVNPKHAEAFYYRGLSRIRLKQAKSIQDFNKALALNPTLFQAFLSRAAYYGLRGQYTKAILNCNEAIKLQPNSIRSYLYRGALKYHIRAYKLAILDLTQATIIDSKCTLAYFNRAICHHKSGQLTKALQDYGVVLLLGDELRLKVLINRGLLYIERKDFKNALRDFLHASEFEPRNKRFLHTLGVCYHKVRKLKHSVECYTKALSFDPYFLDAYIGRGNTFLEYGNETGITMARHDYERALHLDPSCLQARVNLAYCLQLKNKYMLAWRQFTAAITFNPRFKPALEGRAIINLKMNNTFAAYHDITASIEVEPTAELHTNRGVIHQFMNDKTNAMKDYQKALKLDMTYALAYFNAANVYFQMRQFPQALAYYDQAILYNKDDESAVLNRGITKVLLKNSKGALQDFERAAEMSPKSAHIYFNRGNLYASLNEFQKAEEDYDRALEIHIDDALVLRRRADVRGKLGKRDLAVEDYKRAIDLQTKRKRIVTPQFQVEEDS